MWEHILIIVIVVVAALYVVRGLRRSAVGKDSCGEDGCAGCAHGGGCGHRVDETCPGDHSHNETEPRQP